MVDDKSRERWKMGWRRVMNITYVTYLPLKLSFLVKVNIFELYLYLIELK